MLSNSSKYAIKAVLYLAINSNEKRKLKVKDIAQPINVPSPYLAKLLQNLSRQHIISSVRGPKGGFYLSKDDRENTIYTIINAIDGDQKLTSCLLSIDKCNEVKPCPLHQFASPFRTELLNIFRKKTIAKMSFDVDSGGAFLPL